MIHAFGELRRCNQSFQPRPVTTKPHVPIVRLQILVTRKVLYQRVTVRARHSSYVHPVYQKAACVESRACDCAETTRWLLHNGAKKKNNFFPIFSDKPMTDSRRQYNIPSRLFRYQ